MDGYYEDDETVALVVSAASKLNLGAGDVLNMFGVFFVKFLKVFAQCHEKRMRHASDLTRTAGNPGQLAGQTASHYGTQPQRLSA